MRRKKVFVLFNSICSQYILIFSGGHVHIFPFQKGPLDPCFPQRDNDSYVQDCFNFSNKSNSHGVRGDTLLSNLKYFKPTECTNIDYMHSILEGVVKRFFKFWFEVTVREEDPFDFSLKKHINEIDRRLLNIRIPSFIPTTPRSIRDYKLWRAKEFLSFLIYYSLPIFYDLMDNKFLINLTKLVVATEFLLQKKILKSDLIYVKEILKAFVLEVEQIYPANIMLSGMHELLHIVDCTINFGPINFVNCFQYEEINRKIVKFINGYDLVGVEFITNFSILQSLQMFYQSFTSNNAFNKFIEKHKIVKSSNKKRVNQESCILGPLEIITDEQYRIISENFNLDGVQRDQIKSCKRLNFNGVLYTTSKNISKRVDYCVKVDLFYGLISEFIVIKNKVFVLIQRVDHLHSPFYDENNPQIKSQSFLCNITDEIFLSTLDKLKKVALIRVNDGLCFISDFSISHLFL